MNKMIALSNILKVFYWTADSEPIQGIWIVKEEDKEEFEVVQELFKEYPIFLLNSDHQDNIAIALVYLALNNSKSAKEIHNVIFRIQDFRVVSLILSALDAFASMNNHEIKNMTAEIVKITNKDPKYDSIIYLLEILQNITFQIEKTYYQSIYGYLSQKCWWFEIPLFKDRLQTITKEIKKIRAPFRDIIQGYFKNLKKNFDFFSRHHVEKNFMLVSAYCFSLSAYYLKMKLFTNSFLLIHRSLDLFFTSVSIKFKLILVKRDHLVYYDQSLPYHTVRLTESFSYLKKEIGFSDEEALFINKINKKRNTLLLTHGVESLSKSEVYNAFQEARKTMINDQDWKTYLEDFSFPYVQLNSADILYEYFNLKHLLRPF